VEASKKYFAEICSRFIAAKRQEGKKGKARLSLADFLQLKFQQK